MNTTTFGSLGNGAVNLSNAVEAPGDSKAQLTNQSTEGGHFSMDDHRQEGGGSHLQKRDPLREKFPAMIYCNFEDADSDYHPPNFMKRIEIRVRQHLAFQGSEGSRSSFEHLLEPEHYDQYVNVKQNQQEKDAQTISPPLPYRRSAFCQTNPFSDLGSLWGEKPKPTDQFTLFCDRTKELSISQTEASETSVSDVNIPRLTFKMLDKNEVCLSDVCHLNLYEKVFLSNILIIRHGGDLLDPFLPLPTYIEELNLRLGRPGFKRKDESLRWIYKRAIKQLLYDHTDYRPTKYSTMDRFILKLGAKYFPDKPELNELMLDSSYASRKKIQMLADASAQFKQDRTS